MAIFRARLNDLEAKDLIDYKTQIIELQYSLSNSITIYLSDKDSRFYNYEFDYLNFTEALIIARLFVNNDTETKIEIIDEQPNNLIKALCNLAKREHIEKLKLLANNYEEFLKKAFLNIDFEQH